MMAKARRLRKVTRVKLAPTVPFAFDPTFYKPGHFPSGDNHWQPGIRWQTWFWQGRPLGLKFVNLGSVRQPQLGVDVYHNGKLSAAEMGSLIGEISYRFNLDLDITPFYQAFAKDLVLGPIIKRWRGMRPGHPNSLYEYLIIGVVLQNAAVYRSVQMFQALLESFGTLLDFDGRKLWCFWPSGGLGRVSETQLRSLKVGYRDKFIKRIDEQFANGAIDEFELRHQDLNTQKEKLLELYGVGPATVGYLLFDVFHHWDFFDHISPWEQKIYSKLFFDRDPEKPVPVKKLLQHFEGYGDYKQLVVHYLWEDIWWRRKHQPVPWLEKLIRL